jgi:hypothetical protein
MQKGRSLRRALDGFQIDLMDQSGFTGSRPWSLLLSRTAARPPMAMRPAMMAPMPNPKPLAATGA